MTDDSITVVDNEAAQQYETHIDGLLARLVYQRSGERIILIHTDVPDALAGRGIGSALARAALEDAGARRLRVVPRCPFVRSYIERHPEHRGLVTGHASPQP
jgi:predicted GNAT family acetyltransferase